MRVAFVGAGPITVGAADILIRRRVDVVIIEKDKERIEALAEMLDCGFIHGDGSKPAMLREVGPQHTDVLCCLTDNDQSNILASLVGRSLGFSRIITQIEDAEFEHVCLELGLTDLIIPHRQAALALADLACGALPEDFANFFKNGARLFSFAVREEEVGKVGDLPLPKRCMAICIYRYDKMILPAKDVQLELGDEVVLLAHESSLRELRDHWTVAPPEAETGESGTV
ncbi:MAG TPA: TrkA family potassium uptake protein [Candidatus Competibacteraceae bacterium]|nr:TrkA family potassium uptake protein [Candidatus Competibacteraceae bacterium]